MAKILVADDEPKLGRIIQDALELDAHDVTRVQSGRAALVELAARTFDVVLTDLRMPDVDGLKVIEEARRLENPPEIVLMTAYATTETAVAAMKAGAADYLVKPFAVDELRIRIGRIAEQKSAQTLNQTLLGRLVPDLVATSPKMKAALTAARQVAKTDATVLLLGESGTGKSQLARFIHYSSARSQGPFAEVHCAALPETLLESQLFGHEKGSFTGAQERRPGLLSAADRGTLFLDEVGEITASTQVKLLRFLQSREFISVGATTPQRVDTRVISATNRDLQKAVRDGEFREDFFYRLNVFSIEVPPLRERREDILPIAERHLVNRGISPARLSSGARTRLVEQLWQGNIRELENALERAIILAGEDELKAEHFAQLAAVGRARGGPATAADVLREGFNLDAFERDLIFAALERAGGNKAAAARLLGISRRRLYSRLESLNNPAEDTDPGL